MDCTFKKYVKFFVFSVIYFVKYQILPFKRTTSTLLFKEERNQHVTFAFPESPGIYYQRN